MIIYTIDNSIIKDVRSTSKSLLQVEKFNIDIRDVNFNENLAETQLGMSFYELLDKAFENRKEEKRTKYSRLTMAFSMLNFLGLDKEKNKKVKYLNTYHDSEHFFYGTTADWVVSDDNGFINKSRFLVNLYSLNVEVLNFKQFIGKLKLLVRASKISASKLIRCIINEFDNGLIPNSRLSMEKLQKMTVIKPRITILEFFNRISYVEMTDGSNRRYIILYNDGRRIYHFNWFKDFKRMTNKLIEIFGIDDHGIGLYSDIEQKDIESNKWYGRQWNSDKVQIKLSKNIETNRLNLIIGNI